MYEDIWYKDNSPINQLAQIKMSQLTQILGLLTHVFGQLTNYFGQLTQICGQLIRFFFT